MKIGTFVGKQFLEISKDERNYIAEEIKSALKSNGIQMDDVDINMIVGSSDTHMIFFQIILPFKMVLEYRDSNGNTYLPKRINVSICKQQGYDEAVHGKFYEWKDGYKPDYDITSYSCTVDMMGNWRRYRSRTVNYGVGVTKTGYSFGTEISDLDCKADVTRMIKFIKTSIQNTGKKMM